MSESSRAFLEAFPCLPIAQLPTPLHPLPGLQAALGPTAPRLLIKRDDLTGLALGGNKARKLEYLFADARAQGADTLLTCGAAQSNHALQTAAAARRFGFAVRCILYGAQPAPDAPVSGNLLLHRLLETHIRWVRMQEGETRREQALRRGMAEEAEAVRAAGGVPYSIPTGGSTEVGALGYVRAVQEAKAQLEEMQAGAVSAIFFASGSGGTHAGMTVGAKLTDWQTRLVGVEIDPIPPGADGVSPFHRAVLNLMDATAARLGLPADYTLSDITLCPDYAGPAYGTPTQEGQEAIRLLAQTEGIFLDPVYTGKAMAALIGWIRAGRFRPDETVLFWHTGGVAGLFAT
ncbi:MAG TPA: D-cysteine desulfhydrase family protein [Chthonomonadaceae bacterium]|nr:D-cysteine desulfhydrase family protein [Chthonomonadaceae bacterium]